MNYWWVNQGGSYKVEHAHSFMWSPQTEIDGKRNQGYENMQLLVPGDYIFSNVNGFISAIGRVQSYYYFSERPHEFPDFQNKKNNSGWKVNVVFKKINPIRHSDHLDKIIPLMPKKYAPIDGRGRAAMKLYLLHLPYELAQLLMTIGSINENDFPPISSEVSEEAQILSIQNDHSLNTTEKKAIINSRRGQGIFRERVMQIEKICRISDIDDPRFLIASHIKPWRDSSNLERLDGENGLLLSPNIDKLFDHNFISFQENGDLIISDLVSPTLRKKFGLNGIKNVGPFSQKQKIYLTFHFSRLK